MNTKQEKQKGYELIGFIQFPKPKPTLFRKILNKLLWSEEKVEKVAHWHLGKKADGPQVFLEKILKLVAILLWIIVGLNLIITILIYKIFFQ
jgi:hypothetical protein